MTKSNQRKKKKKRRQLSPMISFRAIHLLYHKNLTASNYSKSGYPNRALPLPIDHRQPRPHKTIDEVDLFSAEPVWTQLVPVTPKGQYLLFWYICETLSPEDEAAFLLSRVQVSDEKEKDEKDAASFARDKLPTPPQFTFAIPPYPQDLTLEERIKLEPEGWEPTRVEGTGVDEDEAMYVSYLLSVPQALERLKGSLSASVVSKGLELIHLRKQMEKEKAEIVAQKSTQE